MPDHTHDPALPGSNFNGRHSRLVKALCDGTGGRFDSDSGPQFQPIGVGAGMGFEIAGRPSRWISIYRERATGREAQALRITQVMHPVQVYSHVATDLYFVPFVGAPFFEKYNVQVGGWVFWPIFFVGKNGPKKYASADEFTERFELVKEQSLLELHPEYRPVQP